jgi:arylsulfatase A-like enzyme
MAGLMAAGMLALIMGTADPAAAAEGDRPNILFAFADDWGTEAGAYGTNGIETPAFDRVAEQGVLFEHAYVSSPSCTPSRGAVVAGQHFWRLEEGANLWSTLSADIPLYTDLLAEARYFVGHSRKGWGPGRLEPGGRDHNPAGPKFRSFEQFLDQRPDGEPFCFWFGAQDPHRPYNAELRESMGVDPAEVEVPAVFPDTPAVRRDIADYYAEVQRFDREVGRMLQRLKEMGELENTIVVMTGDHGMPFPRHKGNLYDSGANVPLAIAWPEGVEGGRIVTDFANLADLAPTFLEAAGVDVPEQMTGDSLMPVLTASGSGRIDPDRDAVFIGRERHTPAQAAGNPGGYPSRAIRTDRFLYIRNFKPNRWPAGTPDHQNAYEENGWLGDCDNGPTKSYMWGHRDEPIVSRLYDLSFAKRPAEELYDVRADPHQMHNVADDPAYQQVRKRLRERLMTELEETDDPRATDAPVKFDDYPYYGGIPTWPGADALKQYE